MKLGTLDLAIIISYFVLVLSVGFFLRSKIKTSADFLLTDRSLSLDHRDRFHVSESWVAGNHGAYR